MQILLIMDQFPVIVDNLKRDKIASCSLTIERYLIRFSLGFTYLAPMQSLFGTIAIDFNIWLRILLVASSVLFLVELEKYFVRQMNRNK